MDHTTIWRWVQQYGPEMLRRLQGEVKRKSSTWHMDETFVRIAGKWVYLFRAVDSHGQTVDFYLSATRDREAAKIFLKKPWRMPIIGRHTCLPETACGAIRRRFASSRARGGFGGIAVSEHAATAISGSNPITATSSAGYDPAGTTHGGNGVGGDSGS